MKILVTGGAGFIGSAVTDEFVRLGHNVTVIDNLSSGRKEQVNRRARFVKLDIQNHSAVRRLIKKSRFDVVSHLAAQIDVRKSVAEPLFDAEVNVLGTLNLLDASRESGVKKFLFSASGGTVYGECRKPATESNPEIPMSPYGVAKLASEKYIQAYAALYGLRFTIFRYANVYGPRQDPHGEAGVVAIFSKQLLQQQRSFIFGDGKQTRDFVFVGDVARANGLALTRAHNEIVNIGTGVETSVNTLYRTMANVLDFKPEPIYKPARSGELQRSVLAIAKAARVLKWKPQFDLRSGLEKTIEYFADRLND